MSILFTDKTYDPVDLPDAPGIYCILNRKDGKRYIGQAERLNRRFILHGSQLRRKTHHNQHLQRAWYKHGSENFEFIVLELIEDKKLLTSREQFWADHFNSFDPDKGYNKGRDLEVWNRGRKATPEERARLSALHKSNMTPERLHQLRTMNIGRPLSKEHREKCHFCFLGKTHSPESRKALSEGQSRYQATMTKEEKRKVFGHRMKTIYLVSPDGNPYQITGLHGFCLETKTDRAAILRVTKGKNKSHKGWTLFKGDISSTIFVKKDYR